MQIIEISEPGAKEDKDSSNNEIIVGIDFGTTNSLIAISNQGKTEIISPKNENELIPSIVGFDNHKGDFVVGKKAIELDNNIRSIKRLIAKSSEEIQNNKSLFSLSNNLILEGKLPKIRFRETNFNITTIASKIFSYLKSQAENKLGNEIKKAVVSIPAYFDDISRGQILIAAKLAGIDVMRLIAEPTAAAYAYGLNNNSKGTYLVYDLGGGTFDVSILNIQKGILQVIATGGDSMLGGDDIDILLAKYISDSLKIEFSKEIILLAKKAKEELSSSNKTIVDVGDKQIIILQEKFQEIINDFVTKTISIVKQVLYDADHIDLDGIILVGGSTRVPLISEKLKKHFQAPIYSDLNPDKIVAIGAAMQAENLSSKSNSLLLDVTPLSLGLELYGGITEKIIFRNTTIPFSVKKEFTTHLDNQTGITFNIVQGEREMAKDCRSLANFELKGISPQKAGKARIEVVFSIDANGILSVGARDLDSGISCDIDVKPTYGISEEEILNDLHNAFENAQKDHKERLLVEARNSAKTLLLRITEAINESGDLISKKEMEKINHSINSLQNSINLDNRDDILIKTENLNKITSTFVEKYLNEKANFLLKNLHIDDINN